MPVYGIAYRVMPTERLLLHPITFDTREEAQEYTKRLDGKLKDLKACVFECEEPENKQSLCEVAERLKN
jgi:hypothetical protein